ncbi:MAG TPA: hypothetical protein VLX29_05415 [Nitrospirota bacterium]|nr:hypothetical protein [Nitrospirota bacterium]
MESDYVSIFEQNEAGEYLRPEPSMEFLCKWCSGMCTRGPRTDKYGSDEDWDLVLLVDENPICQYCTKEETVKNKYKVVWEIL